MFDHGNDVSVCSADGRVVEVGKRKRDAVNPFQNPLDDPSDGSAIKNRSARVGPRLMPEMIISGCLFKIALSAILTQSAGVPLTLQAVVSSSQGLPVH